MAQRGHQSLWWWQGHTRKREKGKKKILFVRYSSKVSLNFKQNFIQVTNFIILIVKRNQCWTRTNGWNHRIHWILGPKGALNLVGEMEIIFSKSSHFTDEKSKAPKSVSIKSVILSAGCPRVVCTGNSGISFTHFLAVKSVLTHRSEDLLSLWGGNAVGDYGSFSVCYLTIIRQLIIVPWWTSLSSLKKKGWFKEWEKVYESDTHVSCQGSKEATQKTR